MKFPILKLSKKFRDNNVDTLYTNYLYLYLHYKKAQDRIYNIQNILYFNFVLAWGDWNGTYEMKGNNGGRRKCLKKKKMSKV